MIENQTCPKCASEKISKGKQIGQARMVPIDNKSLLTASTIIAEICTACGYIIETRVEKPEIFK